jgi:Domain of unknown function (DUF4116)
LSCVKPDVLKDNQLFVLSALVNDNKHWVNFIVLKPYVAIGNRGANCGQFPGVKIYKKDSGRLTDLFYNDESGSDSSRVAYLPQPEQLTGSCSRKSLEAALLGSIFLLLYKENPTVDQDILVREAQMIFQAWDESDQVLSLNQIMDKGIEHYQTSLLSRIFSIYTSCPKTLEKFYSLLGSKGKIDWTSCDSRRWRPCDYAVARENKLAFKYEHFLLAAIRQNEMALQFVPEDLKKDKEIVLAAVQPYGLALQFAHEDLKKDEISCCCRSHFMCYFTDFV